MQSSFLRLSLPENSTSNLGSYVRLMQIPMKNRKADHSEQRRERDNSRKTYEEEYQFIVSNSKLRPVKPVHYRPQRVRLK